MARAAFNKEVTVLKLSSFSRNVKQRRKDACLKTTQFTYNGTYYQQVFGTAMGSPVSVVMEDDYG